MSGRWSLIEVEDVAPLSGGHVLRRVTDRALTPEEVLATKSCHGIIDDEVLSQLALTRRGRRSSSKQLEHAVRTLYTLGFGIEAIEDWFSLDTKQVFTIVRDIVRSTLRLWYLAGWPNWRIAERSGVSLGTLMKYTRDIARVPRGLGRRELSVDDKCAVLELAREGWSGTQIAKAACRSPSSINNWIRNSGVKVMRLTEEKIQAIRAEYTNGTKLKDIAAKVGASMGSVICHVKDLPARSPRKGVKLGPRPNRARREGPAMPLECAATPDAAEPTKEVA